MNDPSHIRRRLFLHAAGAAAAVATLPAFAQQPDFPRRPIRLIVGFPPGGQGDALARLMAEKIKQVAGWDIFVDNRPGGALVLATDLVAKAVPEGYTVGLFPQASISANQVLFRKLPFDPNRGFVPLAVIGRASIALVAHPSLGVDNLKDLLEASRKSGGISYGTTAAGTLGHVVVETINRETGSQLRFVAYKGEGQGVQDLLGGHIKLMVVTAQGLHTVMEANPACKPIAVSGRRRWKSHPDMPTVEEVLGANPAYTLSGWQGFLGPAGMPPAVVQAFGQAIREAWMLPETQQRLEALSVMPEFHGPADFNRLYQSETATWVKALTDLGLQGSAG